MNKLLVLVAIASVALLRAVLTAGSVLERDATVSSDFDPAGTSSQIAAMYRYAESEPELMREIACYCGCGPSLGHANLRDCFLRPDRSGYDEHASVCMICVSEAEDAQRLQATGMDHSAIRAWIDSEYSKYGQSTEVR